MGVPARAGRSASRTPAGEPWPAERALLRTLLYYHAFRFPLRLEELRRLAERPWAHPEEPEAALAGLVARGLVAREGSLFLVGDPAQAREREAGERAAERVLPRALRRARLIGRFPFVRGVALSGTLSKGVHHPGDDVDFFAITAPGRVWICRTLLMTFKKLFLLNSHRLFCVNYLVDQESLTIPERNLFTATEIAWLRPALGARALDAFLAANRWVEERLPNWRPAAVEVGEPAQGRLARAVERAVAGSRGDRLDARCRALVAWHNRRRYAHLPREVYDVALRTEPHASKHHPGAFQHRILARYQELLAAFGASHGLSLGGPEAVA